MKISLRTALCAGAVLSVAAAWMFLCVPARAADTVPAIKTSASVPKADATAKPAKPGQINEEQLGNLLQAMGLEAKKIESRYDFQFKAVHNKEEWDLSMTAVLSQDGSSIWLMAWLDQLPKSSADVPRTALLRLLSDNDRLGSGKFFAYVATNRRFVLQRVVANEGVTTKVFRGWLDDLGGSVAETFDHWSVAAWKAPEAGSTATTTKSTPSQTAKSDADDAGDETPATKPATGPNFKGAGQNPVRTALPTKPGTSRN
jgi:hypothetical protein